MKRSVVLSAVASAAAILTLNGFAFAEAKKVPGEKQPLTAQQEKKGAGKEEGNKKVYWTWKKEQKGVKYGNLAITWNADTVFHTITAPASLKASKKEGDILAAVMENSYVKTGADTDVSVKSLYPAGDGDGLIAETKDGKFLLYPKMEEGKEPQATAIKYPAGTVPSQTLKTAIFVDKEKKEATIYGKSGNKLRSYPLASIPAEFPAVHSPFFKDEELLLIISAEGDATYFNRDKKLWTVSLGAPIKAVASSYMKDELLAFGTANEVIFVNVQDGQITGRAPFKSDKLLLDCSQGGKFCAALGQGTYGQKVEAFTRKGEKMWEYAVKGKAGHGYFKVQALEKGNIIAPEIQEGSIVVAGLDEKDGPQVEAFDAKKGGKVWEAPLGTGAEDYRVSWGAHAMAVIYKDTLTYYNFKASNEPKKELPMHPIAAAPNKGPGKEEPAGSGDGKRKK